MELDISVELDIPVEPVVVELDAPVELVSR